MHGASCVYVVCHQPRAALFQLLATIGSQILLLPARNDLTLLYHHLGPFLKCQLYQLSKQCVREAV